MGLVFKQLPWDRQMLMNEKTGVIPILLCRFSVIGDAIQKVQCHYDLIKAHAVR